MNWFNIEGKYVQYGARLADLMWLNLLTTICCIPVFTAGAALTAMHYVLLQMVRDQDSRITSSFFRSFKSNFKQSTIVWLFLLVAGCLLALDLYWTANPEYGFTSLLLAGIIIAAVLWVCVIVWIFPLMCHYKNTIKNTVKNTLQLTLLYPLVFIKMLFFYLVPIILFLFWEQSIIFILLLGFTGPGIACSIQYNKVFLKYDVPSI